MGCGIATGVSTGTGVDVGCFIGSGVGNLVGSGVGSSVGFDVGTSVGFCTKNMVAKLNIPTNTTTAIILFLHFFMIPISSPSVMSLCAAPYKIVPYTTPP